jgi:hypothetical protein
MKKAGSKAKPGDELVFVPLGGAGEIGMNLNLYGYGPESKRQWIMIDLGVMFGGDDTPGVDVIMPDPGFIEEHRRNLLGIVLTHAHEDHIGAVGHLWSRFKVPVYATPFTAVLVRGKLEEAGILDDVPLHVVPLGGAWCCTREIGKSIPTLSSVVKPILPLCAAPVMTACWLPFAIPQTSLCPVGQGRRPMLPNGLRVSLPRVRVGWLSVLLPQMLRACSQ